MSKNPFKCHEEFFLYLQPTMIPPKNAFDIFPPDWGMLRRSIDVFRFFFKRVMETTSAARSKMFTPYIKGNYNSNIISVHTMYYVHTRVS